MIREGKFLAQAQCPRCCIIAGGPGNSENITMVQSEV